MAEYRTDQKRMLLAFLQANAYSSYTVEELVEGMGALYGPSVPGKSTVYRLITRMVEEGSVKRFVKGHSRRFVYQIVAGRHCHSHLHMKCTVCGRLLHLDEALSRRLTESVFASGGFAVDQEETVLFGRCSDCASRSQTKIGASETIQ